MLQEEMQILVTKYGICPVVVALLDEAARLTLCDYSSDAVKVFDILRAVQEVLCDGQTG
jgi:hypothetical protein